MQQNEQRVLLIDHSGTTLAIISKLIHAHIPNAKVDAAMNCQELVNTIRNDLSVKATPLIVVSGEKMGIFEEQMICKLVNGYFDKKLGQQKLVDYINSFLNTNPPEATISGNILYVEDSATVALATKNLLNKHSYNYLHAKDAEQALQHLQHSFSKDHVQPFDLLLTDIQLEGHMTGRDLIREIRHGLGLGYEQLPILVTTSSNYDMDPDGPNRIFSSGANDIIEKPVKEPMLIARLNNLLMLRRQYLEIHYPDNVTGISH